LKILIFGAGSTGRGHLAALLFEHGYDQITFVERDPHLAAVLNQSRRYQVRLLGDDTKTITVQGFQVLDRDNEAGIYEAFLEADMVFTAVIAENLYDVSDIAAKAIAHRRKAGLTNFLNIIACENLKNASSLLKRITLEKLPVEDRQYAEAWIGFPDAMISRVVPYATQHPLYITAENYNEWVINRVGFKGQDPEFPFMKLIDNLEARLERKLWIHNGGHAAVAYAGYHKGYTYIHEAVLDHEIGRFAGRLLDEIGAAILHKHPFTLEEIEAYKMDLVHRGSIPEMQDEILRVVRDPIRKLGIQDRLLGPALYAENHGLCNASLVESVLDVLCYDNADDVESMEMQQIIHTCGLGDLLERRLELAPYPTFVEKIIRRGEQHETFKDR